MTKTSLDQNTQEIHVHVHVITCNYKQKATESDQKPTESRKTLIISSATHN